jgi:hypothetical protein
MPTMKSARRPGSSALTPTVMAEVSRVILSSSTMMPMVALSENSPLPSKTALRARGATLSCASRLPTALKSSNRIELGRFTYDACRRLGLCSNERSRRLREKWVLRLFEYASNNPVDIIDPSGLKDCDKPCDCAAGTLETDSFNNRCCERNCKLGIVVEAPCRSVSDQVLANILKGNPPDLGVVTGHAFISGMCTRRTGIGFYPDPYLPSGPFDPTDGSVDDTDANHPWTHVERIGPMCACSMRCISEKVRLIEDKDPPYQVCPGKDQLNCTTFVTRLLASCGFPKDLSIEPYQLSLRPGMKENPNRKCTPDTAGR